MTITAEHIFSSLKRLPYSRASLEVYLDHMRVMTRNRLDLSPASTWTPLEDHIREGIFVLHSRSLGMHFILVNVDAGKGFFGGQKTSVATYVSRNGDDYEAGPILGSLVRALTGINNIYREAGILKGLIC